MSVNGSGFRPIKRVKGGHHTTGIYWVKQVELLRPDADEPDTSPQVGERDELETFVGLKVFENNLRGFEELAQWLQVRLACFDSRDWRTNCCGNSIGNH